MNENNRNSHQSVFCCVFLVLMVLIVSVYSQHDIAAPYLLEPPDARGRSLAGGGGVYADGAIAAFYNPAGLATTNAVSIEYGKPNFWAKTYNGDIPKNIWISAQLSNDGYGGIYGYYENYEYGNAIPDIMGLFIKYDLTIGGSLALNVNDHSSIGLGAKFIHYEPKYFSPAQPHIHDNASKTTIAFDIGYRSSNNFTDATVRPPWGDLPKLREFCRIYNSRGFAFGVSVMNLGSGINYFDNSRKSPIPRKINLNAGYQVLDSDILSTQVTIDGSKMLFDLNDQFNTEIREITWTFGIEATTIYLITFRAGGHLDKIGEERYNAYGVGIGPQWLRLDYSRIGYDQSGWRDNQESWSINLNIPFGLIHK